jgi:hypothetical protein
MIINENSPVPAGNGNYKFNLASLNTRIYIVNFLFSDNSIEALKVIVK